MAKINQKKEDGDKDLVKEASKDAGFAKGTSKSLAHSLILAPMITEKSHSLIVQNKYVFKVTGAAAKGSVAKAVKDLYGVTVTEVNIVKIPPKKRIYGRSIGWKSGFKKAIVTLKAGDKIEMFEGV